MKNFLSFLEMDPKRLIELASRALEIKAGSKVSSISGKVLGLIFFNPSLRTKTSFEVLMSKFGGNSLVISPGSDSWGLEIKEGAVMNSNSPEHIKEAARVLSRYCDALGIRSFTSLQDVTKDGQGETLEGFRKWSTVPIINLESAVEHPCQALSDMVTLKEKLKNPRKKRFTLSWAPQVKATPMAVPHSAILSAAASGMDITVVHPPGYELVPRYLSFAKELSQKEGGSLEVKIAETVKEQEKITASSDVLYVKSWGAMPFYESMQKQEADFIRRKDWMISPQHLGKHTLLMHCLPVRRNVVIGDAALDSDNSIIIDQAENRLWAQSALMEEIFS